MLDSHRLHVLVAVADAGSVSGAAEVLGYGQPTISHHLSRLEAETGARLTQRVGRGIRLTPEGRQLVHRGREILALLRRAENEVTLASNQRSGIVTWAVFPAAASTIVPATLTRLARRLPGLEVRLVEAEPPEALALLRSGEVDVALTFHDGRPASDEGFIRTELLVDPVRLILPRSGPGAGRRRLAEHADSRWISGCERCRSQLVDLCDRAGFTPDIGFATDDFVAVQHLVAAGFGVSTLPQLALDAFTHPRVAVVELPGASRVIEAATFGQPPRPRSVEELVAALPAG